MSYFDVLKAHVKYLIIILTENNLCVLFNISFKINIIQTY